MQNTKEVACGMAIFFSKERREIFSVVKAPIKCWGENDKHAKIQNVEKLQRRGNIRYMRP
jgi:hypothetical protein